MSKKILLHVGPSMLRIQHTTAGFNDGTWEELRFDIDPSVKPDITGTMTDMSNVPSASIDGIYSSHNLEHLYPHEVPIALAEFMRILKPSGFVVLTCPDLKSIAKLIVDDQLEDTAYMSPAGPIAPLDILYGFRASMQRGNLYMAHRTGFTGKTLMNAFLQAKFNKMITTHRESPAFDLWIVATKNIRSDEDIRSLAAQHFPR